MMKIRNLKKQLIRMEETVNQLKNRDKSSRDMKRLENDLEMAMDKIKRNPRITPTEIDGLYTSLVNQVNKQMADLQDMVKQEKVAEEQARLKKIQQELELEKKRKEEEERKKREDVEHRKKKLEMEARRKIEEEQRRKQEEEDQKTAAALQVCRISHVSLFLLHFPDYTNNIVRLLIYSLFAGPTGEGGYGRDSISGIAGARKKRPRVGSQTCSGIERTSRGFSATCTKVRNREFNFSGEGNRDCR